MDTVKRVQELATEYGMSVFQLFKLSNINYNTFSSAEKRGGQLSVETIERICTALNISLSEFFSSNQDEHLTQAEKCSPLTAEEIKILRQIIAERKTITQ